MEESPQPLIQESEPKKKHWFAPLVIVCIVLVGIGIFVATENHKESPAHDDVHYHAGFRVVVDGEAQSYDGWEYMHTSPCSVEAAEATPPDLSDVTNRIHLHNQIGDVAHIHDEGVTWEDLFQSLGIAKLLSEDVFVYNEEGVLVTDGMKRTIAPYERVVIAIGEPLGEETVLEQMVLPEDILTAEAQVENCGAGA